MLGFHPGAVHRGDLSLESEGAPIQGTPIFLPALLFFVV